MLSLPPSFVLGEGDARGQANMWQDGRAPSNPKIAEHQFPIFAHGEVIGDFLYT